MTAFTVLRLAKLKSWGAVGGDGSHNARLRATLNADPEALVKNRFLAGAPGDDLAVLCQARLTGMKIRRNAVYAVEGVLSASPEYFRPGQAERYGYADPDRLEAWVTASWDWLQNKYGDRVMSAVLHLDEATPHVQFLILPLDEKGHLNCRKLFGGSRQVLADLQTDYAQAVAHLGLTRGRAGSQAKHQEVAAYYQATQNLNSGSITAGSVFEDIQVPEPPGTLARLKDQNLTDYARGTVAQAIHDQAARLDPVFKNLTAEVARLREEQEQLKDSQARLAQENAAFRVEAKKLRDMNLDFVLTRMFGAVENSDSKPSARRFELPDGQIIEYAGEHWQEQPQGQKGKGAINLVMHLSGYGQEHYQQAVRDMSATFGDQETTASLAQYLAGTAPRKFGELIRGAFQKPPASDIYWPVVREYLIDQLHFPVAFVDKLHQDGLVYSDRRKDAVFPKTQDTGAFKIGLGPKTFTQNLGRDSRPYVLPGSDSAVYITDTPLEGLSLKLLHPDSTILATGGFLTLDKLKPYLDGKKEIFLAQTRDRRSQEYARLLAQAYPQAKLIQPERGQNWLECWQLQVAEQQRVPTVAVAQDNADALPKLNQGPGR